MGVLDGKVALVTGGNSGIGEDCVYGLAREGAKVLFCGRNEESGMQVERNCIEQGGVAKFVKADISKVEDHKMLVDETINDFGRLDIVVANAGGGSENLPLDVMSNNQWVHDVMVYINSPLLLSKYAIPHMIEQGNGGSIIFMSSASVYKLSPGQGGYASGKAANWELAKQISLEYCRQGIRANNILPAATRTKMIKENPQIAAMVNARANARSANEVKEVTDAVIYLASDASKSVTGTQIIIDRASSAGVMPDLIYGAAGIKY